MKARCSDFSLEPKIYDCKFNWPEGFYQCGDNGIVLKGSLQDVLSDHQKACDIASSVLNGEDPADTDYRTAFFEAFPEDLESFIRGEGKTIEVAEENAWNKYQRFLNCSGHEFEAKSYKNGCGICKHCGMFKSNVIESPHSCVICGEKTWYITDVDNAYYCKKHADQIPEDKKWDIRKLTDLFTKTKDI